MATATTDQTLIPALGMEPGEGERIFEQFREHGVPAALLENVPPLRKLFGNCLEEHAPRVGVGPLGYCRLVLYTSAEIEIVFLYWLKGARTPLHDHGARQSREGYEGSNGVTVVAMGRLEDFRDGRITAYEKGHVFVEGPATVHRVRALEESVSFHAYTPPATGRMTIIAE